MSIYFSEKFKELRKNKDLTQEQIADIFHISPQAVSRWETGATYPDIEILPHLAIFFEVTVDELLGTEKIIGEEKAKEYVRDIRNLLNSGKISDAIELARKAGKEYPMNHSLDYHLLQALTAACTGESPEKFKDDIITVGERIIRNAPNEWGIKSELVRQYAKWGMKEEAKKILDTMPPEIWYAKEVWKGCILEGDDWKRNQQIVMIRTMVLLCHFIGEYSYKAELKPLEKIECIKMGEQIQKIIAPITSDVASSFHDDTETEDYVQSTFQNIRIAELYCEARDTENAMDYVEKATQDSLHHINRMDTTNADGSNYMAWSTPRNLPWILWEDHLSKPQFDIIRNEERFIKCFDELKANSHELK